MISEILRRDLFFFQAEDGIRYLVRSRGLGDVYKRQFVVPEAIRAETLFVDEIVRPLYVRDFAYPLERHLSLIHI